MNKCEDCPLTLLLYSVNDYTVYECSLPFCLLETITYHIMTYLYAAGGITYSNYIHMDYY